MTQTMISIVSQACYYRLGSKSVIPTFDELCKELVQLAFATEEKDLIPADTLQNLINRIEMTHEQMRVMWYLVHAVESRIRRNPQLDDRYRNFSLSDALDDMHKKYLIETGINLLDEMLFGRQLSEHERYLIASM